MTKFKIGDKVKLKEGVDFDDTLYNGIYHYEKMKFEGVRKVKDVDIYGTGYRLEASDYRYGEDVLELAQETNFEHYQDSFKNFLSKEKRLDGYEIGIKELNGGITLGNWRSVSFDADDDYEIDIKTLKWLLKPYKKSVTLTPEQLFLLNQMADEGCKYLARDNDGVLFTYTHAPTRQEEMWYTDVGESDDVPSYADIFSFIAWEDTEPTSIEELIKNPGGKNNENH